VVFPGPAYPRSRLSKKIVAGRVKGQGSLHSRATGFAAATEQKNGRTRGEGTKCLLYDSDQRSAVNTPMEGGVGKGGKKRGGKHRRVLLKKQLIGDSKRKIKSKMRPESQKKGFKEKKNFGPRGLGKVTQVKKEQGKKKRKGRGKPPEMKLTLLI